MEMNFDFHFINSIPLEIADLNDLNELFMVKFDHSFSDLPNIIKSMMENYQVFTEDEISDHLEIFNNYELYLSDKWKDIPEIAQLRTILERNCIILKNQATINKGLSKKTLLIRKMRNDLPKGFNIIGL